MREPQPYLKKRKKSRNCWYVHWRGHDVRLDRDEKTAWAMYRQLAAGNPFQRDGVYVFWSDDEGQLVTLGTAREDEAAEKVKVLKTGGRLDKNPLVGEVFDWFLEWHRQNGSADKTIEFYDGSIRSFRAWLTEKRLTDLRAADLKIHHVEQWFAEKHRTYTKKVAELDENGRKIVIKSKRNGQRHRAYKTRLETKATSDTQKHNLYRGVQTPFRLAFHKEVIAHWPLRGLEKPTQDSGKDVIPVNNWATILAAVEDQEFRDVLVMLWQTGARPDEVRRAEARHFDRERRCVVFPWQEAKGRRTSKKDRVIHLRDEAFEIVQRLALKQPDGPLFRNEDGQPWRKNAFVLRCSRLSEKTGIKFTAYQIRHTFATRMHAAGVDRKTAADLMGHRDTKMLDRVYTHPADETLREGLRKLG